MHFEILLYFILFEINDIQTNDCSKYENWMCELLTYIIILSHNDNDNI